MPAGKVLSESGARDENLLPASLTKIDQLRGGRAIKAGKNQKLTDMAVAGQCLGDRQPDAARLSDVPQAWRRSPCRRSEQRVIQSGNVRSIAIDYVAGSQDVSLA